MALVPQYLTTRTEILSPAQLAQSAHLPAVVDLINDAFPRMVLGSSNGNLFSHNLVKRFENPTQLPAELEPDGFMILMFSSYTSPVQITESLTIDRAAAETLVATGGARPFKSAEPKGEEVEKNLRLAFQPMTFNATASDTDAKTRKSDDDDEAAGLLRWELATLAVHRSLLNKGLALKIMTEGIAEIHTRAAASIVKQRKQSLKGDCTITSNPRDADGEPTRGKRKPRVKLLASARFRGFELFLHKLGFVTTGVKRYEPGTLGLRDGVSVAELMRWDDLDLALTVEGKRRDEADRRMGRELKL